MPTLERKRVANLICQLADDSEKRAGESLPSERAMAERFGCSRTTVRAALGRLERQGILGRFHGKGTILLESPKNNSANPQKERILQIGLFVVNGDLLIDAYALLAMGMRSVLGNRSYQINFLQVDTRQGLDTADMPALEDMPDLFVVTGDFKSTDLVWLSKQRKPIIVLGHWGDTVKALVNVPYLHIYYDYRSAYMRATEHLWSMGYRKPAILIGSTHHAYMDRYAGFCDALRHHGQDPEDFMRFMMYTEESNGRGSPQERKIAVEKILQTRDKFDSLITGNYIEVLGAARRKNISTQGDFALIAETYGHDRFIEEFGVTELRADHHTIGMLAGQKVEGLRNYHVSTQGHLSVPMELIIRNSTLDVKKNKPVRTSV